MRLRLAILPSASHWMTRVKGKQGRHLVPGPRSQGCEDDVLATGPCSVSATPGSPQRDGVKVFKDFVTRQKVRTLSSMRPVHSICLEAERVNLARAMMLAERFCQPSRLLCLRTDELIVDIPKGDRAKFKARVEAVTYADGQAKSLAM